MTDRDEFFLARTDAVHEKLTEWIEAIQKQSPDELANFMSRPPAVLAEYLLQRLTRNGDGRLLTTTLTR